MHLFIKINVKKPLKPKRIYYVVIKNKLSRQLTETKIPSTIMFCVNAITLLFAKTFSYGNFSCPLTSVETLHLSLIETRM